MDNIAVKVATSAVASSIVAVSTESVTVGAASSSTIPVVCWLGAPTVPFVTVFISTITVSFVPVSYTESLTAVTVIAPVVFPAVINIDAPEAV